MNTLPNCLVSGGEMSWNEIKHSTRKHGRKSAGSWIEFGCKVARADIISPASVDLSEVCSACKLCIVANFERERASKACQSNGNRWLLSDCIHHRWPKASIQRSGVVTFLTLSASCKFAIIDWRAIVLRRAHCIVIIGYLAVPEYPSILQCSKQSKLSNQFSLFLAFVQSSSRDMLVCDCISLRFWFSIARDRWRAKSNNNSNNNVTTTLCLMPVKSSSVDCW